MVKVDLIDYFDVWGNEEDGWDINNLRRECTLELPEDFTNGDILEALKEAEFFHDGVTLEMVRFEDLGEFGVELYEAATNRPSCRIEIIHN